MFLFYKDLNALKIKSIDQLNAFWNFNENLLKVETNIDA